METPNGQDEPSESTGRKRKAGADFDAPSAKRHEMAVEEGDLLILDLPTEILVHVFGFLTRASLKVCTLVCRTFAEALPASAAKPVARDMCAMAAEDGDLVMLTWSRGRGCPWGDALAAAAASNRLEVVTWMLVTRPASLSFAAASKSAAKEGHVAMLALLQDRGRLWRLKALRAAARAGRQEIFEYMLAREPTRMRKWLKNPSLCALAAEHGHVPLIEWLHDRQGCPWDYDACARAARRGRLDTLKWLRGRRCPGNERVLINAAAAGHALVLEWALDNGYHHYSDCPPVSEAAALGGHNGILALLVARYCRLSGNCMAGAASNGHVVTLEWLKGLHEETYGILYEWEEIRNPIVLQKALDGSHSDAAKWLIRNGASCSLPSLESIVKDGALDLLRLLNEMRAMPEYDSRICRIAVECGQFETLKHLREVGWIRLEDFRPYRTACWKGRRDIAAWMMENGFAWRADDALSLLPLDQSVPARQTIHAMVRRAQETPQGS